MHNQTFNLEKTLSNTEIEAIENLGIKIKGETFNKEQIFAICNIAKEQYLNINISYEEANKYYDFYNRFNKINKVDLEKVCEHSKEEFKKDIFLETHIFHAVRWSNPEDVNQNHLKNTGKNMSEEEYSKYKIRHEKAKDDMEKYYQYMEEKYGNLEGARSWYNIYF